MNGQIAAQTLREHLHFLNNVLKDFREEHAHFRPTPEMLTTAQQIRHIAETIHWFREGAFGSGFEMDFEKMEKKMKQDISLKQALQELDTAWNEMCALLEPMTEEQLLQPMPPNPIFKNDPKVACVWAAMDHTAHHRGALTVYLRLLGITPTMIYTPPAEG
jgi:uncharacterized damage-inducible protein DinB